MLYKKDFIMKERVLEVVETLFAEKEFSMFEDASINDKLQALISESMLALMLVTSLEDEFDIEFDDDEIDINFFSDIDVIINRTITHIKNKDD